MRSVVWSASHHLISNLKLTFDGPDHAHGVCDVECMGTSQDDSVQMAGATYRDDFERREGIWKIARRHMTLHYMNPIPGAKLSTP